MSTRLDVMTQSQIVNQPPTADFIRNEGGLVKEDLVYVATIDAPVEKRQYLIDHGVDLTWAEYDLDTLRWERCLLSEGVADLLEELHAEGSFPYPFQAVPSQGELEWIEAQVRGETKRPKLPQLELRATAGSDTEQATPRKPRGTDPANTP